MPARRRKLSKRRKKKKLPKWIFFTLLFAVVFIFLFVRTRYWGKSSNLVLVSPSDKGVTVYVFSRAKEEMYRINIPANTEVKTAHDLGTWKIGNVWQLGLNEGLDGRLLADTVIKNFFFPVGIWTDSSFNKMIGGNFWEILKSLFVRKTNLEVGDMVKILFFSHKIKDFQKYEIDLAKTNFLKKTKLKDGEDGFIVTDNFAKKLLPVFAEFEEGKIKASIIYEFDERSLANTVAKTIEVMGAKPISIRKEASNYNNFSGNCLVRTKTKTVAERIADAFSCDFADDLKGESGVDVEIVLGKSFSDRF